MNDYKRNQHKSDWRESPERTKLPRDATHETCHQEYLDDSSPLGGSFFEMAEEYVADSKDHGRNCNRHPHGRNCNASIGQSPDRAGSRIQSEPQAGV